MAFKTTGTVHGVPRSTLQFCCSEKFTKASHGPSPVVNDMEEKILVSSIFDCARKGFPKRKEDVQKRVNECLRQIKDRTHLKIICLVTNGTVASYVDIRKFRIEYQKE